MRYNAAFTPVFNADPLNAGVAYPEPVSLAEIKDHLHISNSAEDTWLTSAGKVARLKIENYTGEYFKPRNITIIFQNQLGGFVLPFHPVGNITYVDIDAVAITDYDADYEYENVMTATFDAGYGFAVNPVPEDIKSAILMQVAFMYVNRGDSNKNGVVSEIAQALALPYKRMVI